MTDIAQSAVFVSSAAVAADVEALPCVAGPCGGFDDAEHLLSYYGTLGFQATHFSRACALAQRMLEPQPPSKNYIIRDGEFVEVKAGGDAKLQDDELPEALVYPTIFLGMAANLLGTGCREALRFLVQTGVRPRPLDGVTTATGFVCRCQNAGVRAVGSSEIDFTQLREWRYRELAAGQSWRSQGKLNETPAAVGRQGHTPLPTSRAGAAAAPCPSGAAAELPLHHSFLSAVVVSGGGMEHDLRRACEPYAVTQYASALRGSGSNAAWDCCARFGNVLYTRPPVTAVRPGGCSMRDGNDSPGGRSRDDQGLFDLLMRKLIAALLMRQERIHEEMAVMTGVGWWATTPSEVWALAGLWLEDLFEDALMELHARKTAEAAPAVAELHEEAVRRARSTVLYWAALQEVPIFSPSFVDGDVMTYILQATAPALLKIDLVRDIHGINKLAMYSKCTGMIICGGGVVKHHICNANLMRNGADYTVLLGNGQEFDGSDAGARPEEAVSWGKIRIDGSSVKVYSEITTVFPLLVAQVFVAAARRVCEGV